MKKDAPLTEWEREAFDSGPARVCHERRVLIGSFGSGPETAQFGIAFERELRDKGFTVAGQQRDADLVLAGVLTMTNVVSIRPLIMGGVGVGPQPTVAARATRAPTGEPVWSDTYEMNPIDPRALRRAPRK